MDLSLGTLTSEVPASGGMPRYAVLDLNSGSTTNTAGNYTTLPVLLYGRGPNGTSSTRVGATSISSVTISGDFLKGSGSAWTFDFAGTGANGWYRLVDWEGTTTFDAANFAWTNLALGKDGSFVVDAPTSALYLQVIPEPRSAALALLFAAALLGRRVRDA